MGRITKSGKPDKRFGYKPRERCYSCGSIRDKNGICIHKQCAYCKMYPPKCWACRYFDQEELSKEIRKAINVGRWRLNRAQCPDCKDVITSIHRGDFRHCKCGALFVDGGSWYLRRGGKQEVLDRMIEMSVKYESAKDE